MQSATHIVDFERLKIVSISLMNSTRVLILASGPPLKTDLTIGLQTDKRSACDAASISFEQHMNNKLAHVCIISRIL
jgi:hypothetical protein